MNACACPDIVQMVSDEVLAKKLNLEATLRLCYANVPSSFMKRVDEGYSLPTKESLENLSAFLKNLGNASVGQSSSLTKDSPTLPPIDVHPALTPLPETPPLSPIAMTPLPPTPRSPTTSLPDTPPLFPIATMPFPPTPSSPQKPHSLLPPTPTADFVMPTGMREAILAAKRGYVEKPVKKVATEECFEDVMQRVIAAAHRAMQ